MHNMNNEIKKEEAGIMPGNNIPVTPVGSGNMVPPTPTPTAMPMPGVMPGGPVANPSVSPVPSTIPSPAPMPGVAPVQAPIPGSMPSPMPSPMPGSTPTPTPMPGSTPAPMPGVVPAPMPGSIPVPTPAPMPGSMPGVAPAPMPGVAPINNDINSNTEVPVTPTPVSTPTMMPNMGIGQTPVAPSIGVPPMGTPVQPIGSSAPMSSGFGTPPLPGNDANFNNAERIIVPEQETVGVIPPNPVDEKKKNPVIIIIIAVVLIAAIGIGIYFFLTGTNEKVTLQNKQFLINEELPSDCANYGEYTNVSTSNCVLDITAVDTSKSGMYPYTVTCNGNIYAAEIEIIDNRNFVVESQDAVFKLDGEYNLNEFISYCSTETCSYTIDEENQASIEENLKVSGGPYDITINVVDESGNQEVIEAQYYVTIAYLDASTDEITSENYDATYIIKDRLYFQTGNIYVNKGYRYYEYTFNSSESYEQAKIDYNTNNSLEGNTGSIEFDDEAQIILITNNLSTTTLSEEYGDTFPTAYKDIYSYYKGNGLTVKVIQ